MATRRAVANGNWSSTSTWNGGVLPGNGDTVYANGFNVTIDQNIDIGGANNPTVNAGSFVSGQWYEIDFVGTTIFTSIGAASNTTGTVFLATGVGSGTGTAKALATLSTVANTAAGAGAGGSFTMSTVYAMTCDLRAGTTTCLNLTATSGTLALSNLRIIGGASSNANGMNAAAGSLWSLDGCSVNGGSVNGSIGINSNSTGGITINSLCNFTGGGGGLGNAYALNNASTGNITVAGACIFSGGSGGGVVLNNATTGSITITASCIFTAGVFACLSNSSTGSVNVSGACSFTAGSGANSFAISNLSAGSLIVNNSTFAASAFTNAVLASNTSADVRLSGDFLDHWSGWRAVNSPKFRLGTAPTLGQTRYALAGTTDSYFVMYGADNGSFGNPVASDVRSGISYGGGNLTGTCAVPAAGSVALGVPVDATTGTAVLTPASVWEYATREITGGTVDTLTNAPASVTPADIWSHSSRTLTSASGSAPTASAVADAVWNRQTSAITTANSIGERVKNTATTSIVGNLLAQANS
jgi:hypothetical protein